MPTSGEGVMLCDGRGLLRANGALAVYKQGLLPCCPSVLTPVWTFGGLLTMPHLTETRSMERTCQLSSVERTDSVTNYYRLCVSCPNESASYVNAVLNGTMSGTAPLYPGYPTGAQVWRARCGGVARIPIGWYVGGGKTVGVGSVRCWHYREGLEAGVYQFGSDGWNRNCCEGDGQPVYPWWTSDPSIVWSVGTWWGVRARHYIGTPGVKQVGENGLMTAVTVLDGEWTTQTDVIVQWSAQHPDVHVYSSLPVVAASGWGQGPAWGTIWPPTFSKTYWTITNPTGEHIVLEYYGGSPSYRQWVTAYYRTYGYRPYPGEPAPHCVYHGVNTDQDNSGWKPVGAQPYASSPF